MTTLRFRATPLTPIHVGSGQTLAPEEYLIRDDMFIRFNPHAVLRDMAAADRLEYEKRLERNEFQAAQRLLQSCCKPDRHGLYRVEIGRGSQRELRDLVNTPERRGEVQALLRNPHSGAPVLPGSSLKGAIRTAVVNGFARDHRSAVKQAVNAEPRKDRRWQALEETALNFELRRTESDPLRMLHVADAELPRDAARVDQAQVVKYSAVGQPLKMQVHCERLLSRADAEPPEFTVELRFAERQAGHGPVAARLGRSLDLEQIRRECNSFYVERMRAELERFFAAEGEPEARYGAAGVIQWRNGKVLIAKSLRERGWLLRVGRFSHFESLSVDGLREGWNFQKRQPITGMGSTRTLCETRTGRRSPFGWLLLSPEDRP